MILIDYHLNSIKNEPSEYSFIQNSEQFLDFIDIEALKHIKETKCIF